MPELPTAEELVDTYAGTGSAPQALDWFHALGRFKMAAIMGHNLRRHREGRHHDPDQERLPATIARLISTGRAPGRLSRPREARRTMDFSYSARTKELLERLESFMDEHVYPAEPVYDEQIAASDNPHEQPPIMRELQASARELGLVEPLHDPRATGVPDSPTSNTRRWRRSLGRSIIGNEAVNCSAPDTGNMEILAHVRDAGAAATRGCGRCWTAGSVGVRDDRTRGGQLRRHATSPRPSIGTATSTCSTGGSGTPPGSWTRTAN